MPDKEALSSIEVLIHKANATAKQPPDGVEGNIKVFKAVYRALSAMTFQVGEPKPYANVPQNVYTHKTEEIDKEICLDLSIVATSPFLSSNQPPASPTPYAAKTNLADFSKKSGYCDCPNILINAYNTVVTALQATSVYFINEFWKAVEPIFEPVLKKLQADFEVLRQSQLEKSSSLIEKKRKSVRASRERAQRPVNVEKRNNASKEKALIALGKVLAPRPKLVDLGPEKLGPEKLRDLTNLFLTCWWELEELSKWVRTRAKGSSLLTTEDLEEAVKLASISQVISS